MRIRCPGLGQYFAQYARNARGAKNDRLLVDAETGKSQITSSLLYMLTRRRKQTDLRYNAQIHSIIVALSLHVVVLIKDLNGNHVIQKCLNKLAPEDNQACLRLKARALL